MTLEPLKKSLLTEKGKQAEQLAKAFLEDRGYRILIQNFRSPWGEIDLIARQGKFLVFVEVRSRTDATLGKAEETITFPKQRRLTKTAQAYLAKHPTHLETRFDVVAIHWQPTGVPQITLFPDAFLPCQQS